MRHFHEIFLSRDKNLRNNEVFMWKHSCPCDTFLTFLSHEMKISWKCLVVDTPSFTDWRVNAIEAKRTRTHWGMFLVVVVTDHRQRWRRIPRSWWASIVLWGRPRPGRRCAWSRHPIGHRLPSRRLTVATTTITNTSLRRAANLSAYCYPSRPVDDPSCSSSSSGSNSDRSSNSSTASCTVATSSRFRSRNSI